MKRTIRESAKLLGTILPRSSTGIGICSAPPCRSTRRGVWPESSRALFSSTTASQAPSAVDIQTESPVRITQHSGASVSIQAPNTFDLSADTALVDGLLSHTREIMGDIGSIPHHIIAFSGGVDSSLVAALVHHSQSSNNNEAVRAVLGISPAVPADQIDLARRVAAHIGISMSEIPTEEGSDETYIANNGQACLACKTHLYSTLQAVADHSLSNTKSTGIASSSHESLQQHQEQQHQQQLYNGTNADDVLDPTRLGLIAANNYRVQSPIRHISKADVRRAARHLGLPNWNYAASPCLRSRLALGVPAVQEHLQRIERAERFVRQQLSERSTTASMSMSASANTTTKPAATVLDETSNLRVRLLAGNRACIEVDPENLKAASQQLEQGSWQEHFCNDLGFTSVDIRSFKSGSVATTDNSIPASKETRASETTTSSTSDDDRAASFG